MTWRMTEVSHGNSGSMRVLGNTNKQTGVCESRRKLIAIGVVVDKEMCRWNLASDEQIHKPCFVGIPLCFWVSEALDGD